MIFGIGFGRQGALPTDSIEQFSYLLFLKRLHDDENKREKQAKRRNQNFEPKIPLKLRWSEWRNLTQTRLRGSFSLITIALLVS